MCTRGWRAGRSRERKGEESKEAGRKQRRTAPALYAHTERIRRRRRAEDPGVNDVFLFLAQSVPLLDDEHLRTPHALLSGNVKERKEEKHRGRWQSRSKSEQERELNKSMERHCGERRWRGREPETAFETPLVLKSRHRDLFPTSCSSGADKRAASSTCTGQKSKVKITRLSYPLLFSPASPGVLPRSVHPAEKP